MYAICFASLFLYLLFLVGVFVCSLCFVREDVSLETIADFPKMKSITTDMSMIVCALKQSDQLQARAFNLFCFPFFFFAAEPVRFGNS